MMASKINPTTSHSDGSYIPECQLMFRQESSWKHELEQCTKNPGHEGFLPAKEFLSSPEHQGKIPRDNWSDVIALCKRTVRVVVRHTSENRPNYYPGTETPYPYCQWKGCCWPVRYATGVVIGEFVSAEPIRSSVNEIDEKTGIIGLSDRSHLSNPDRFNPDETIKSSTKVLEDLEIPIKSSTGVVIAKEHINGDPLKFSCGNDDEKPICVKSTGSSSGGIRDVADPKITCPCPECEESEQPMTDFWLCYLVTATHAVCNDEEATETTFEVDFDDENREDVKFIYGVDPSTVSFQHRLSDFKEIRANRFITDSNIVLGVTHDRDLAEQFNSGAYTMPTSKVINTGMIVSHPHGGPKMVSFGFMKNFTVLEKTKMTNPDSNATIPYCLHFCVVESTFGEDIFPQGTLFIDMNDCFGENEPREDKAWCFPRGTLVVSPDQTQMALLKDVSIPDRCLSAVTHMAMTYDIPTCPGSSGAMHHQAEGVCVALHSGAKGYLNMGKISRPGPLKQKCFQSSVT